MDISSCFFIYEFFLRTFIWIVAPQIILDLHLSLESFALIGSAYYIDYAIIQIQVRILENKFRVKWIIIFFRFDLRWFSIIIFTRYRQDSLPLFFSRALMGFGSSFAFIFLLIAATWFPQHYFWFFFGASQFVGTMGPHF